MAWRHRGPMEQAEPCHNLVACRCWQTSAWQTNAMQEVATFPSPQCKFANLGGAAKGSRAGWYRRRCVLRHPRRTPLVPNGTGQRCVGRYCVPEPHTLGYWQDGSWARVWKQGGIRRKMKLLFLWESGNRTKKHRILLTALFRGKERRCSRRLLRKSKVQHLWVARVRAASSTSWITWGLTGTRGAPLSCERLDAPA